MARRGSMRARVRAVREDPEGLAHEGVRMGYLLCTHRCNQRASCTALERAALFAALDRFAGPFVRTAFSAAARRSLRVRLRAAERA